MDGWGQENGAQDSAADDALQKRPGRSAPSGLSDACSPKALETPQQFEKSLRGRWGQQSGKLGSLGFRVQGYQHLQVEHRLRHDGKENGNHYSISGLYKDNGKEKGNHSSILGLYRDNGKGNGNHVVSFL